MNQVLVTYFGPFNHFQENPAELIANKLQRIFQSNSCVCFKKLEVSFDSIDQFLESRLDEYDSIIELGVATKSEKIRLEEFATNFIVGTDVNGIQKNGLIDISGSETKRSTFKSFDLIEWSSDFSPNVILSQSAGKYLCNYLYYKSLNRFLNKNILFIHLANFIDLPTVPSLDIQVEIIQSFVEKSCQNT